MLNVSVYAGSICVGVGSIDGYGRIMGDEIFFISYGTKHLEFT